MNRLIIVIYLSFSILTNSFAQAPYFDNRKLYIHPGVDELGNFNWGHVLTCFEISSFSSDKGPRKINLSTPRLVTTTINNQFWVFAIREDTDKVILESITINTQHSCSEQDKRRLFLNIIRDYELD